MIYRQASRHQTLMDMQNCFGKPRRPGEEIDRRVGGVAKLKPWVFGGTIGGQAVIALRKGGAIFPGEKKRLDFGYLVVLVSSIMGFAASPPMSGLTTIFHHAMRR
jgi:hypothetical protein